MAAEELASRLAVHKRERTALETAILAAQKGWCFRPERRVCFRVVSFSPSPHRTIPLAGTNIIPSFEFQGCTLYFYQLRTTTFGSAHERIYRHVCCTISIGKHATILWVLHSSYVVWDSGYPLVGGDEKTLFATSFNVVQVTIGGGCDVSTDSFCAFHVRVSLENRSLQEKLAEALEGVRQKQEAEQQTDNVIRELQVRRNAPFRLSGKCKAPHVAGSL